MLALCATAAQADGDPPNDPSFLLFAGTDLWRDSAFVDGGVLWSPSGLKASGFTLKLLLNGGLYTYPSSSLHTDVEGTLASAAAMPGWRTTQNGFTLGLYAGRVVQDYRLTPYDPGSRLHGLYGRAQVGGDVWYQPAPAAMIAVDGSIASIALTGSARAAVS